MRQFRIFGALKGTLGRLVRAPPELVLFMGVIFGVVLIALSFAIGIAEIVNLKGQQVGYAFSVNWVAGFSLALPAMAFFGLSAIQSMEYVMRSMAAQNMIVDTNWAPVEESEISECWKKRFDRTYGAGVAFFVIGIVASLAEWWFGSALPLMNGDLGGNEPDWSTAAVFMSGEDAPNVWLNGAFGAFVFLYQGIAVGLILYFLLFVVVAGWFLREHASQKASPWIIPNLESTDHRRGFENLEGLVGHILAYCGAVFCFFYFGALHNAYLNHQKAFASLIDFIGKDIVDGFALFEDKNFGVFLGVLSTVAEPNYSSNIVALGGAVVSLCVLIFITVSLREAAKLSQAQVLGILQTTSSEHPLPFAGLTNAECQTNVRSMTWWPFTQAYLKMNALLTYVMICFLSLVFYRLGVVLAVFIVLALLSALLARVIKKIK